MSNAKSKQLRELRRKPERDRFDAMQFRSPLHREACDFLMMITQGELSTGLPENAVEEFRRRLMDAWKRKDGSFFRALGDAIQEGNRNRDWSERERFIYAQCSISAKLGEPLPSAGQILRGWKIRCGVPDAGDLKIFLGKSIPKSQAQIEKKLRPLLGEPNPTAADVQIVQIQREAKNFGYDLPRQRKRGMPAGMQSE